MSRPPYGQKYPPFAVLAACLTLFAVALSSPCLAQPAASAPLKVGIYVNPPFVIKTGSGYSGMAIDIWQDSAAKLGLSYRYVEMPTFPDLLQATAAGQIDIAVSNITITQELMQRMDFTQPWFNSGLRVMIDQDRQDRLGALIALTLIDRQYDKEFPESWSEGLVESLYHVLSVVTSGKSSHKSLSGIYGRLIAAFWLLCGVAVVGAFCQQHVVNYINFISYPQAAFRRRPKCQEFNALLGYLNFITTSRRQNFIGILARAQPGDDLGYYIAGYRQGCHQQPCRGQVTARNVSVVFRSGTP